MYSITVCIKCIINVCCLKAHRDAFLTHVAFLGTDGAPRHILCNFDCFLRTFLPNLIRVIWIFGVIGL